MDPQEPQSEPMERIDERLELVIEQNIRLYDKMDIIQKELNEHEMRHEEASQSDFGNFVSFVGLGLAITSTILVAFFGKLPH